MSLQLRQNLKLSQQLVMTPQLQQAIKLLQLSQTELVQTVEEALLENPLLERRQEQDSDEGNPGGTEGESKADGEEAVSFTGQENDMARTAEWEDYLGVFSSTSKSVSERELPDDAASLEAISSVKPSLESHLSWQLHLSHLTSRQIKIGEVLVQNLDSSGYFGITLDEAASLAQCPPEEAEEVLHAIQRFDPVGVASRNLQECLVRQLELQEWEDPVLFSLVRDHLSDLEELDIRHLASRLNVSREQVEEYLDILRSLDPRPGSSFGGGETIYVSPDVFVYNFDGEFLIMLNEDELPDVGLNAQYQDMTGIQDKKEKDFVQQKMREATWLIKSIQQRQRTLYRVMESIVRFQRDFFEKGMTALKPMVLRDVAEDIEVHESTVSRVTANKFVSTPQGLFELKFFFSSGVGTDGGGNMSAVSVKSAIKDMIRDEDPKKPLSDKLIAERLNERFDLNIARRTVAKYREAQDTPSSSRRRKKVR
jgi:RNA polymerase sigma-54 factor